MSFAGAVRSAFRNYATFSGRALRSEFWWFQLFIIAVNVGLFAVAGLLGQRGGVLAFLALVLFDLAALLPYLAVQVRRLHDTDHSGWWLLLSLIPVAELILLIFYCLEGTRGTNRYGPSPIGVGAGPQRRYAGRDQPEALQLFSEDAQRAAAAGFRPVRQDWSEQDGQHVLVVMYEQAPPGPSWG
jgi:uncharacterized membrane protein YhaH (DUF805 family)